MLLTFPRPARARATTPVCRYYAAKNPKTEFAGYSIPHPSENKMQLRIQTKKSESAKEVLIESLDNIMSVCDNILDAFKKTEKRDDDAKMEE